MKNIWMKKTKPKYRSLTGKEKAVRTCGRLLSYLWDLVEKRNGVGFGKGSAAEPLKLLGIVLQRLAQRKQRQRVIVPYCADEQRDFLAVSDGKRFCLTACADCGGSGQALRKLGRRMAVAKPALRADIKRVGAVLP